jgi:hypothetical protein
LIGLKQSLQQSVLLVLSSFVATLLFGRTREMATDAVNIVYIGGI